MNIMLLSSGWSHKWQPAFSNGCGRDDFFCVNCAIGTSYGSANFSALPQGMWWGNFESGASLGSELCTADIKGFLRLEKHQLINSSASEVKLGATGQSDWWLPSFGTSDAGFWDAPLLLVARETRTIFKLDPMKRGARQTGAKSGASEPLLSGTRDLSLFFPAKNVIQISRKDSTTFIFNQQVTLSPSHTIWVNCNNSLTWMVRPFGDDFP